MRNLLVYIVGRLREPSSWRGIVAMLTAAGVWNIGSTETDQLIALGLAVIGALGAFLPDLRPKPDDGSDSAA